jgi:hypothetical protein
MWRRRSLRRAGLLLALAGALAMAVPASHQAEADPRTSLPTHAPSGVGSTEPSHDGYYWLDYFRAVGGLGPLAPNATMQAQEASHVRYLADHSLGCETDVHDELIGPGAGCGANPYATAAGKLAANNSDITRIDAAVSDRVAVQNWFVSGFHALTLLEPRLRSTGYASYYTPHPTGAGPNPYQFTAGVDVYRGRTGSYSGQRLTFPIAGSTSPLLSYRVGTELPEPFGSTLPGSPCHSWAARDVVSAPIIVQWPLGHRPVQAPATIVDVTTGRPLPTCALTAGQYPAGSLASTFLLGTNRVTQAALYYADAPFRPGHRYQLLVGATVLTDFRTAG